MKPNFRGKQAIVEEKTPLIQSFANYFEAHYPRDFLAGTKKAGKANLEEEEGAQKADKELEREYRNFNLELTSQSLRRLEDVRPELFKEIDAACSETLDYADKLLDLGHNLLFHGLGDKEELVTSFFTKRYGSTHIIVNVRGYDPNMNPRTFFIKLLELFEFRTAEISALTDEIEKIKKKRNPDLENIQHTILLLIKQFGLSVLILFHNLDGRNFANRQTIEYISGLARVVEIGFVVTVDTIEFPKLLTRLSSDNFSFISFSLDTYRTYRQQLRYLSFIDPKYKGTQQMDSVKGILDSLTENQR